MFALQLNCRPEGERFAILDILAFIEHDIFEMVGREYINVVSHHAIRSKDQVKMTEEFFRTFLVYSHGVVVFHH